VAAATGRDEARARQDYRERAEDEHRLWEDYNGEFGISADEYAAAIARADTSGHADIIRETLDGTRGI
jgi:hypothetical protein